MIILGLGSNKGDRAAHLREAISLLAPVVTNVQPSRMYESRALLPPGAPADWGSNFLNMAVKGESDLSATELLDAIKTIEKRIGRTSLGRWSPREIDIDILAMDHEVIDLPFLQVPHRELLNRDFALLPLAELAPDWQYPDGEYSGLRAADIVKAKGFRCGALQETGIALYAA